MEGDRLRQGRRARRRPSGAGSRASTAVRETALLWRSAAAEQDRGEPALNIAPNEKRHRNRLFRLLDHRTARHMNILTVSPARSTTCAACWKGLTCLV